MQIIYFVTEGATDQIVLEGLVESWVGDVIPGHIQPPSSEYADETVSNLSQGWKGVVARCSGPPSGGLSGRDEVLRLADCLVIHVDADVASDHDFNNPPFSGSCPHVNPRCDFVREWISSLFGGQMPENVVLCIPSMDMDAWTLCCLHPGVADDHNPIECRAEPGSLLVPLQPRLVRRKDGALRKIQQMYRDNQVRIVAGWPHCASGEEPRCTEAARFERETRQVFNN